MCTLTVCRTSQQLLVTMNRDELRTRAPELAPHDHGSWIGPRDGERGGTWFGLNRRGAVACLLNDYQDSDEEEPALPAPRAGPSRGELIPRLLEQAGADAMREFLRGCDLTPYPAFLLVLLDPKQGWLAHWGSQLAWESVPPGWSLWTSSGWRSAAVKRWRAERFADWLAQGESQVEGVPTFHLLCDPQRPAWSPLAERPLSATRSVTQARLSSQQAAIRYWAAPDWPPEKPAAELTVSLEGGAQASAKPSA